MERLLRFPNRTYLWARHVLDLVESDINIDMTGIRRATSQLPRAVEEAYDTILARGLDAPHIQKVLQIIVAAVRPLTLEEIDTALRFLRDQSSVNPGFTTIVASPPPGEWPLDERVPSIPDERLRKYLGDVCGPFVTILDSKGNLHSPDRQRVPAPE